MWRWKFIILMRNFTRMSVGSLWKMNYSYLKNEWQQQEQQKNEISLYIILFDCFSSLKIINNIYVSFFFFFFYLFRSFIRYIENDDELELFCVKERRKKNSKFMSSFFFNIVQLVVAASLLLLLFILLKCLNIFI